MEYVSTRGQVPAATLSAAVRAGIAADGGLYVPFALPRFEIADFRDDLTLPAIAARFLRPFFDGDRLAPELDAIVTEAFNFPAPLVRLPSVDAVSVLELFHGPTAAFKDFGARFLAACMSRLHTPGARPLTILVATSGDTGGAVAAAFHRRPGIEVIVLYPRGLVSPRQEQQLTCWGDNVHAFQVEGTFDDCQRLVKAAFADPALAAARDLSSANSINLGRLLPQAVYYAATSLQVWRAERRRASFIVPSGNLGNVAACLWARASGLPIGEVVLAHNANRTVPEFLDSGEWQPRASVATLASAMDVGNPSNMERLRALLPDLATMREAIEATSIDDAAIRARIVADQRTYGQTWCPHTATAAEAYSRLTPLRRATQHWVLVATAHPAKFVEIVEPLVGPVTTPPALARLLELPSHSDRLLPELPALQAALGATVLS